MHTNDHRVNRIAAPSGRSGSILGAAPDRPLRILMILESNFTPKGGGGAESQVRTIAQHLKHLGHGVTVLTPMLPWGPQVKAERCYGIPVGRLPYPKQPVLGRLVLSVRLGSFLWRTRHHYDAWHVHIGHHLGAVASLLGSLIDKPVVVKISGWWELEQGLMAPNGGPVVKVALACLRRASAVQAISTRIAAELEQHGFPKERVVVLPNAVDTTRFRARASSGRGADPRFTAVFVGRLVPEKGLGTLLDAWARAFQSDRQARLRLVGSGDLESALREQAKRLGITDQLEFLGHRDRVEEVLSEADIGVLPSRIEGLSNTLLEFMAAGLPTIASRVSGSEDFIVPGRNGWLFPVSDAESLAQCLREASTLAPDALSELGRTAREDVESKAALDLVAGRLLAFYRGESPGAVSSSGIRQGQDGLMSFVQARKVI